MRISVICRHEKEPGYILIEVLLVMILFASIAGIAVPEFAKIYEKAMNVIVSPPLGEARIL